MEQTPPIRAAKFFFFPAKLLVKVITCICFFPKQPCTQASIEISMKHVLPSEKHVIGDAKRERERERLPMCKTPAIFDDRHGCVVQL